MHVKRVTKADTRVSRARKYAKIALAASFRLRLPAPLALDVKAAGSRTSWDKLIAKVPGARPEGSEICPRRRRNRMHVKHVTKADSRIKRAREYAKVALAASIQ